MTTYRDGQGWKSFTPRSPRRWNQDWYGPLGRVTRVDDGRGPLRPHRLGEAAGVGPRAQLRIRADEVSRLVEPARVPAVEVVAERGDAAGDEAAVDVRGHPRVDVEVVGDDGVLDDLGALADAEPAAPAVRERPLVLTAVAGDGRVADRQRVGGAAGLAPAEDAADEPSAISVSILAVRALSAFQA